MEQKDCRSGHLFEGDLPLGTIQNQTLVVAYLDGEYATGRMGYAESAAGAYEHGPAPSRKRLT
jgi:hypothetical protein